MTEHYFSASPASEAGTGVVRFPLDGEEHTLRTARGVFSAGRLDPGTAVLLDRAPRPPDSGTLLDLGCGYGPIACTLARRSPGAQVWAVDSNERALQLTAQNAADWGLSNLSVGEPPAQVRFDAIYTNPPIRIGKAALHELLTAWLSRLTAAGTAYLVVQRNLGADSLQRWLIDQNYTCARLTSAKGYRVFAVQHADTVS